MSLSRWCLILFCGVLTAKIEAAVPASASGNRWTKLTATNFVLYSSASEPETLDWAVELDTCLSYLAASTSTDPALRSRLMIVLFKDAAELAPFQQPLAAYPGQAGATFWRGPVSSLIVASAKEGRAGLGRLIYHE